MKLKSSVLGGTAALAGLLMLGAGALAQDQSGSSAAPSSQATPAQGAQPYGSSGQDQMSSPSQTGAPSDNANANAPMSASMEPATRVKDAKTTLASASVQDSSGQPVGQVVDVHTTRHGTPTTIDISLQANASGSGQAKTIAIKASKLQYDQSSNTLKADLTASDLQSMPAASGM